MITKSILQSIIYVLSANRFRRHIKGAQHSSYLRQEKAVDEEPTVISAGCYHGGTVATTTTSKNLGHQRGIFVSTNRLLARIEERGLTKFLKWVV